MSDTPIDEYENYLVGEIKSIRENSEKVVFKCPKCDKKFHRLSNYGDLGMCFACAKKETIRLMEEKLNILKDGKIIEVETNKPDYVLNKHDMECTIKSITVMTRYGAVRRIETPERPIFI